MANDEVEISLVRKRFVESAASLEAIRSKLESLSQSDEEAKAASDSLQTSVAAMNSLAKDLTEVVSQIGVAVTTLSDVLSKSERFLSQGDSITQALDQIRSELPSVLEANERAAAAEAELAALIKAMPPRVVKKMQS